jgi:hypothetical protein
MLSLWPSSIRLKGVRLSISSFGFIRAGFPLERGNYL